MAQPPLPVIDFDLSRLPSDGTFTRPAGAHYTQITSQDQEFVNFLATLSIRVNNDPTRARATRLFRFVGSLPRGYTIWWHLTRGTGKYTKEIFGHPGGPTKYFRGAESFKDHILEMMAANELRNRQVKAGVIHYNGSLALNAIHYHNYRNLMLAGPGYDPNLFWLDPRNLANANGLYTPVDSDVEVRRYIQNNPVIAVPCTCNLPR